MKPPTLEWVNKSEGDFLTALREVRIRKFPNYDAVCFHSQQCAEKYLKAFLNEKEKIIPKSHVLGDLLGLCLNIDPQFKLIQPALNTLDGYAIQFRYPGQIATQQDARDAVKAAKEIRLFLRIKLDIPTE